MAVCEVFCTIDDTITIALNNDIRDNAILIFYLGIIPIFKSILTFVFMYQAILVMKGESSTNHFMDFVTKMLIVGFCLFIANPSANFFVDLIDMVQSWANNFSALFLKDPSITNVSQSIDGALAAFLKFVKNANKEIKGGVDTTVFFFQVVFMFASMLPAILVMFSTIVILKITLSLLLSVLPLFIIFAGFDKTRAYFFNFINFTLTTIFGLVFATIAFSVIYGALSNLVESGLAVESSTSWFFFSTEKISWEGWFKFIVTNLISALFIYKVSEITSALFGSNAFNSGQASSMMKEHGGNYKNRVTNAAKTAGRGAVAGGKAIVSRWKNKISKVG